jgi:hypothetical protein
MLFYFTLFLAFFYFKVYRVRASVESATVLRHLETFMALGAGLALLVFGFLTLSWYLVLIASIVFFLLSALMIVAIQLGIFVDGQPLIGMDFIFKLMLPLSIIIVALSAAIIIL